MTRVTLDEFNGVRTPEQVMASVPGKKALTVSVVFDREEPIQLALFSVIAETGERVYQGNSLSAAINVYNSLGDDLLDPGETEDGEGFLINGRVIRARA